MYRESKRKREQQGEQEREARREREVEGSRYRGSTPCKVTKCILAATCNNLCDILCFALLQRLRRFGLFAARSNSGSSSSSKLQVASAAATAAATVQ